MADSITLNAPTVSGTAISFGGKCIMVGTHAGHVISIKLLNSSGTEVSGYSVSPDPITIDASGNYSGTITYGGSMAGLTIKATCSYQGSSMSTEAAVPNSSSG